jgi:predicted ATP-grasp superfamily ATP-dependent carboligase
VGKSRLPNVLDPDTKLKGWAIFQSRDAFAALMDKIITLATITYSEPLTSPQEPSK